MVLVPMLLYAAGIVVRSVREHYVDCWVIVLGRFIVQRPVGHFKRIMASVRLVVFSHKNSMPTG